MVVRTSSDVAAPYDLAMHSRRRNVEDDRSQHHDQFARAQAHAMASDCSRCSFQEDGRVQFAGDFVRAKVCAAITGKPACTAARANGAPCGPHANLFQRRGICE